MMIQEASASVIAFLLFHVIPVHTFLKSKGITETGESEILMFFSLAYEWFLGYVLVGVFLGVFAPEYPLFWVFVSASSGVFYSLKFAEFDDQLVNMGTPRQVWGVIVVSLSIGAAWLTRLIFNPIVF